MSTTPIPATAALTTLAPPPIQTPIIGSNNLCSPQWVMWFQKMFLRAGGTVSETVTQITQNITNNNTSTTISDNSSQGGAGIDPDSIDDLDLLSALLPIWRGLDPDNVIPEVPQFNTDSPEFTGTVSLSNASTASTATTGAAGTLPASPLGYISLTINGTSVKIPYYAP